jgi:NTP pyrophosphatase (non-canonical NTP hydrolase)
VSDEKFSNDLSDAQLERLAILSEELGEAQQVIGKVLRHGLHSWNPTVVGTGTNKDDLQKEMGHVAYAVSALCLAGDLEAMEIDRSHHKKIISIKKWLHHQA